MGGFTMADWKVTQYKIWSVYIKYYWIVTEWLTGKDWLTRLVEARMKSREKWLKDYLKRNVRY